MNIITVEPAKLDEKYLKKWNSYNTYDFVNLYVNGVKVNDNLYRVGGFKPNFKDNYFMLIKHVEAYYDNNITKIKKDKPYLAGHWCIIDNNGIEKQVFPSHKNVYITKGIVYSIDSNYYNIETGKRYCYSSKCLKSKDFIFLQNSFDEDESKRGVLKINVNDGSFELFNEENGNNL